ncbi:MAG: GTPase ObgE [Muribaculaceae bacterium]|nr:GTPase ObgE [Muribaculaceae bacterium]MBR5118753.1 GTPase ObgE [Muribaculaceae bacterium]
MAESNFIDYVKIMCRSGHGGAGSKHLHRAKYIPKGGPDGGDGGRGGHIFLKGNRNLWTLIHLKYQRHIFATDGAPGSENQCTGKKGEDRIIEVPCGTAVYDAETGKFLCDVTQDGQVVRLLKGGRGGLGNVHFKTATRQTPRFAQPGEDGVEKSIILELKLLADVGLVGFPNAGKSTLLSVISAAKPKIANYPFTTLEPNLGIVSYRGQQSFVMADIPGIIEGASEGKGLGLRFLRHIERNAVLLFMIPSDTDDIKREYEILSNELATFNPDLVEKPRVLAITKCDLIDDDLREMLRPELPSDLPVVFISSVAQQGLTELKDLLWRTINDEHNRIPDTVALHDLDEQHRVQEEDDFIFAAQDPDYDEMPDAGGKMVVEEQEWDDEYWAEKYEDPDRDFQIVNKEEKEDKEEN